MHGVKSVFVTLFSRTVSSVTYLGKPLVSWKNCVRLFLLCPFTSPEFGTDFKGMDLGDSFVLAN
jgi:hypothetical protein